MGHKPWDMPWRRAERRRGKRAWKNDAEVEGRFYGTDTTDGLDTIVEATLMKDGTVHLTAVTLEGGR